LVRPGRKRFILKTLALLICESERGIGAANIDAESDFFFHGGPGLSSRLLQAEPRESHYANQFRQAYGRKLKTGVLKTRRLYIQSLLFKPTI
jgi:hypothetical protein